MKTEDKQLRGLARATAAQVVRQQQSAARPAATDATVVTCLRTRAALTTSIDPRTLQQ